MRSILDDATNTSLGGTPEYSTKARYSRVHGGIDDKIADRLERYGVLTDRGENRTGAGLLDPDTLKHLSWIRHKATLLGAHLIENGYPEHFCWWIFKQEFKIFIQWLFGRSGGIPTAIYIALLGFIVHHYGKIIF